VAGLHPPPEEGWRGVLHPLQSCGEPRGVMGMVCPTNHIYVHHISAPIRHTARLVQPVRVGARLAQPAAGLTEWPGTKEDQEAPHGSDMQSEWQLPIPRPGQPSGGGWHPGSLICAFACNRNVPAGV
jgi:hypothetical protein